MVTQFVNNLSSLGPSKHVNNTTFSNTAIHKKIQHRLIEQKQAYTSNTCIQYTRNFKKLFNTFSLWC